MCINIISIYVAYVKDIMKMKFDKDLDQNLSERSHS